ncbi:hypothetical protein D3C73_1360050 [compost metagenome]
MVPSTLCDSVGSGVTVGVGDEAADGDGNAVGVGDGITGAPPPPPPPPPEIAVIGEADAGLTVVSFPPILTTVFEGTSFPSSI